MSLKNPQKSANFSTSGSNDVEILGLELCVGCCGLADTVSPSWELKNLNQLAWILQSLHCNLWKHHELRQPQTVSQHIINYSIDFISTSSSVKENILVLCTRVDAGVVYISTSSSIKKPPQIMKSISVILFVFLCCFLETSTSSESLEKGKNCFWQLPDCCFFPSYWQNLSFCILAPFIL